MPRWWSRWAFGRHAKDRPALPGLEEHFVAGSGRVAIRYFLTLSDRRDLRDILVVCYSGHYPPGAEGNEDALFMFSMAKAAVARFDPSGVIHDLSALCYESGDLLGMALDVGPTLGPQHVAIVVGPQCEPAVRSLLAEGIAPDGSGATDHVFRDLLSAWRYVDNRVG